VRHVDEGLPRVLESQSDRLAEPVRRATKILETDASTREVAVASYVTACDELRREIEAIRLAKEERLARARDRWQKALKTWRDVVLAALGKAGDKEGKKVEASGEAALAASRADELESWAAQLEGLTRRFRLESAWIEQSNALLEIEGPLDHDGLPQDEGEPDAQDLLAKYRKAMASGNGEAIRSMAPLLQAQSRDLQRGSGGPDLSDMEIPAPGPAVRRFNERYAPTMLKAFDDLASRFEKSRSQGRQGEAARIAAELQATYGRLLRPPPIWRRPVAQMGVAAMLAAVVTWGLMPSGRSYVAGVSPAGEMRVSEVSRNGGQVGGLPMSVPEEGVVWRGLLPGHYVLSLDNGTRKEFDVPGPEAVLLPGSDGNYTADLMKALGLAQPTP